MQTSVILTSEMGTKRDLAVKEDTKAESYGMNLDVCGKEHFFVGQDKVCGVWVEQSLSDTWLASCTLVT